MSFPPVSTSNYTQVLQRPAGNIQMSMESAKNILGTDLQVCCKNPLTGFMRDGHCNAHEMDAGAHLVCAVVTDTFLEFSKAHGNDLSTPRPEYQFPGLKDGDCWCLCALRWKEAFHAGVAPPIKPEATHERMLELFSRSLLEEHYVQEEA